MRRYTLSELSDERIVELCNRARPYSDDVVQKVEWIIEQVRSRGDAALTELTAEYDGVLAEGIEVSAAEFKAARANLPREVHDALTAAAANIERFHRAQMSGRVEVETVPGVSCFAESRPVPSVGLYVPGGTAPLPSTVLMLAVPAQLAGCPEVVVATPPGRDGRVADAILCAAEMCDVQRVFKIGGAQAIAALAMGTETVPPVHKILGPGTRYVTAAKVLVAADIAATAAIDMPSGPTELLVIADDTARADFVAADLLSQAEHDRDAQPILAATSTELADAVDKALDEQLADLPRRDIAQAALGNGFTLIADSVDEALRFANHYAPEHLSLNVREPRRLADAVISAGSVFLGPYSSEAAGDYASGPNHALPTMGHAHLRGGVSVADYQKQITFQEVTAEGARQLAPTVETLAEVETLEGHRRAMRLRVEGKR